MSFNTWSWSKYWTKPPKTISAHFKDLKYFYRKYFHKNPRIIQQVTNAYCDHLAKPHSIKVSLVHQNAPKPSLTRIKFEQLCSTNFLSLIPTFVSMITWPNEATTPTGASRRSDLLNSICTSSFLLISRVYKSCIGNFAQISSKLVEGPNLMCHFTLWSLMANGDHLLAQTNIKHLLPLYQKPCLVLFH